MIVDVCESRLSVHIECRELRNMDIIGRSDPFALLFLDSTGPSYTGARPAPDASDSMSPSQLQVNAALLAPQRSSLGRGRYPGRDGRWERIGRTETVPNSLACRFANSFEIPYFFERSQKLAVDLFDRDTASMRDQDIHRHDYLGSAEFSVPAVFRAPGQRLEKALKIADRPDQHFGYCTIIVELVSMCKQRINYDLSIRNLRRGMHINRGKGPYLTISRLSAGAETGAEDWIVVFRTKHPGKTRPGHNSYDLGHLTYNYEKFCRCDDNLILRFDVSFERQGKHRIAATSFSSLADLDSANGVLQLQNRRAKDKPARPRSRSSAGLLMLQHRRMEEETTFLDYIIGGCEISLVVAIDFTASNGDPTQRGTLHFWDQHMPNEYERAIRSAGDILAEYDTDQLFPAYGFGAKLPPEYHTPNHRFSLTGTSDPECQGIDQVLNAYRHTLYNVRLSGPTVFAEIIREAANYASSGLHNNEQSYTILLIVTDGVINDMDNTLREIARASSLPLSIVIIGVGAADFTDMNELDGDDLGRERDIVQFVNFRQYMDQPEVLQSKVLEEIPRQFLQYMRYKGLNPMPPPTE